MNPFLVISRFSTSSFSSDPFKGRTIKLRWLIATLIGVMPIHHALSRDAGTASWPDNPPPQYKTHYNKPSAGFGLYLDYVHLSPEFMESRYQGIGSSAVTFGGSFSFFPSDEWVASAGAGFMLLDDEAEFEAAVEEPNGDINYKTSSVTGLQVFIESGPLLHFPNSSIALAPKLGAVFYGATQRSVSDCVNCPEEDIDLVGGAYVGLGLQSRHAGVQLQYHWGGDQDIGVRFQFIF